MADPFRLHVQNVDGTRIQLRWERRRDAQIERSWSRGGDYTTIATPSQATQYVDEPTKKPNTRDRPFYRVTLLDAQGNTEDVMGPSAPSADLDVRAAYVRRQEHRHLRRIGQKSYLVEEGQGERCSDCWDPLRRVQARSECDTCDGSGFVGGWSTPIELYVSYGNSEAVPQDTQGGEIDTQQLQCWTGVSPAISIGDYLVRDRDYEVFEVITRERTWKEAHPLRQNVILRMVERGASAREVTNHIP